MKLAKVCTTEGAVRVAVIEGEEAKLLPSGEDGAASLTQILHSENPRAEVEKLLPKSVTVALDDVRLLAPVDRQEVWAAGVTYKRSQVARMEESESGASHYDKVYSADRPELFFKGTAQRMVHPGQAVRVRFDSQWSVPEPEFTIVLNPNMDIVGYTIGNDMSARDIEGENPLYLPQAKVYKQCCSVGPVIQLAEGPLDKSAVSILLTIERNGAVISRGETGLDQLHRELEDLAGWLGRENEFPDGAFLLTGTGIIPDDNFSLENGDVVSIEISGIGTLTNPVVKD
ncbi:MAG: fumarylacetoacetate hydrolase family protein [Planctomycetaceae bacterium]|nr:fumarylacetoacetate hydrolase family protein [Planctomycetaceae bacterium]MCB9951309.1 fumarylacetoacetate hydrolase family protein [Planctomycetaceae bacterium]